MLLNGLNGTVMNIHQKHLKDLQYLLKKEKLDALVLSRPLEQGFLTGFHMDGMVLLVSRSSAWAFGFGAVNELERPP